MFLFGAMYNILLYCCTCTVRHRRDQRGDSEGVIRFLHEFTESQMFHMHMMHVKVGVGARSPCYTSLLVHIYVEQSISSISSSIQAELYCLASQHEQENSVAVMYLNCLKKISCALLLSIAIAIALRCDCNRLFECYMAGYRMHQQRHLAIDTVLGK